MAQSFELSLTNKCNWYCEYCVVDTHAAPERLFADVVSDAESVPPNSEVTFSGGEPGLLTRAEITKLIDILHAKNCQLDLLTNGTFIRKYPDLLHHFSPINYHCIEHVSSSSKIEFDNLDQSMVNYLIVLQDNNLDDGSILSIMEEYPNIRFLLYPEARPRRKINMGKLVKFINDHKTKLHPNNLGEVAYKMQNHWGENGNHWATVRFNREKQNGSSS